MDQLDRVYPRPIATRDYACTVIHIKQLANGGPRFPNPAVSSYSQHHYLLTSSSLLSGSGSLAVAGVAAPLVGEEVVEEGRGGEEARATKVLGEGWT